MKQKRKMALLLCCLMALSMVILSSCNGDSYPSAAPPADGRFGRPGPQMEVPVNVGETSTLLAGTARAGRNSPSFRLDEVRNPATWWWPSPGPAEHAIVFWGPGEYVFWEVIVSGNHQVEMIMVYWADTWEGGSGTITITRENGEVFQSIDFEIEPSSGDTWSRMRFPRDTRFRWPAGTYTVTITASSANEARSLMSLNNLSFQRV